MKLHLLDQTRTYNSNNRLKQFLRMLRGQFRHPSTEALMRRERNRDPQVARVASWQKARRGSEN
ncbi:hypothetical protein [Loktanella sp. SALINAS62]|uniref:hypothetical protein n=1 Tax=Loktanella sp. SALINAS62 TaxID=2706124 RepID=UPI001B8CE60C|nr:hypothetical protein [Loktanella sp. SALINAS62]MBS1302745.1 hypothetical protein [Loktanella sp. SALINAS62]